MNALPAPESFGVLGVTVWFSEIITVTISIVSVSIIIAYANRMRHARSSASLVNRVIVAVAG
jgi:hypothetical protein